MDIKLRQIGYFNGKPAHAIELIVNSGNSTITETITNFRDEKVDDNFIIQLRSIADELEEHNNKINN